MGKGSGSAGARGGGGGAAKSTATGGTVADVMDRESQRELFGSMSQRTSAGNLLSSNDTKAQALDKMDGAIASVEATLSPNGRYQRALDNAQELPKGYPGRASQIRIAEANISSARSDLAAFKEVRSAIADGAKIDVYTDAGNRLHVRRLG